METYTCFCTLSTGSKHKLTQEAYNQILEADKDDLISLPDGTVFKNSAVMEIQDISEWTDFHKEYDYHQPYTSLPEVSFEGIISRTKHLKHLEALMRGINKAKAKLKKGEPKNINNLLEIANKKYNEVKNGNNEKTQT